MVSLFGRCWGGQLELSSRKNSCFALGFGLEVVEASIIQIISSTKKTSISVISLSSCLVPSSLLCYEPENVNVYLSIGEDINNTTTEASSGAIGIGAVEIFSKGVVGRKTQKHAEVES